MGKKSIMVLQLVGVGWYIAICIVGGLLLGLAIDRKLDTLPFVTIAGVILGSILAFYGIYKMLVPILIDIGATASTDGD